MQSAEAAPFAFAGDSQGSTPPWFGERLVRPFFAYTMAVLLCLAADLVQPSLSPGAAEPSSLVLLLLAVLIASRVGGLACGLWATVLGAPAHPLPLP